MRQQEIVTIKFGKPLLQDGSGKGVREFGLPRASEKAASRYEER